MTAPFGRVATAMLTPFTDDFALDLAGVPRLVGHLLANGTETVVVAGTTGESPTLSHAEHERVVELAVEVANGRVPVIAGAGSNATSTKQLSPAWRVVPAHSSVTTRNSSAASPENRTPVRLIALEPVLVTVTASGSPTPPTTCSPNSSASTEKPAVGVVKR